MSDVFKNIDIPYTAPATPAAQAPMVQVAQPQTVPAEPVKADSVELSAQKPEKKGPIKALKGFVSGVKKFFASAGAYAKGTAKGVATGAVAGSIVYTVGALINAVKKHAAKGTEAVVKKIPNKLLAGVVAVGALAINLWNASLNATQKQSEIDLRYKGLNK